MWHALTERIMPSGIDWIMLVMQVSYMILQRVSPVTHSIGNCVKRVIVIIASVIVFQNPMSKQNMIGTPLPSYNMLLSFCRLLCDELVHPTCVSYEMSCSCTVLLQC